MHWTKKKVIISLLVLIFSGTAVFGACTFLGSPGGATDVTPPSNVDDGTSARPAGKTVADFLDDPKQNLYIANGVLMEAGSFSSISKGTTVSTKIGFSVTQDILAYRVVKGDTVYKLSTSYGLVKMGDERLVHGNTYLYRSATKVNSVNNVEWSDAAPNTLTKEAFLNRYGQRGNGLTGYILNDETILSSSYDGYDEQSGLYTFTYTLDNDKSPAYLLYEMRTNSGSKNFAEFKKAVITVSMDENWVVYSIKTDCAYNVPIAGNTPCKESMTEIFSDIGKITDYTQLPEYDYFGNYVDFSTTPPISDDREDGGNLNPLPTVPDVPTEPQPTDVLMSMFESYLSGAPLNVKLDTKAGGLPIKADLTVNIDLEDLKNITFAAITEGGLKCTYSNNRIYAAVNGVKLRSSVEDILEAVKRFKKTEIPSLDFSSLDIDPSEILENMTLEINDDMATVHIPLSIGDIVAEVNLSGKQTDDDSYVFTNATVEINGVVLSLTAQDKTVPLLDVTDETYVDACAVLFDYIDTINSLTDAKSSANDDKFIEKSWTFEIQPLDLKINGTTYQTQAMNLRLYTSQDKIALTADKLDLTVTATDGTATKTQLSFSGAYMLPTDETEGKLYLTINDLTNPDSDIKISIGSKAIVDCFKKRLPELTEAIPQLKDLLDFKFDKASLLDFSALLSKLDYDRDNDKTLSLSINAAPLFEGLGNLNVSLSQPQENKVTLTINQTDDTLITLRNLSLSVQVDADVPTKQIVDDVYDVTATHINLDSIDTLLQSLINTAKRTSFRLTGKIPVNLNALSIVKADIELGIDIRIDVEKDEHGKDVVYIAAKLSRGELSGVTKLAFADMGGDSYLYYNGKNNTMTIKRNSLTEQKWCSKCNGFECSNTFWHAGFRSNKVISDMDFYGKCSYDTTVTEQQFKENAIDYILQMINFTQTINDTITDAINSEDKKAFGFDDVLVGYSYSSPTYNLTLNLNTIDDVLGDAVVHIDHDDNSDLSSLYGDITLLNVTGVTAKGKFNIYLVSSVDGEAKSLTTQTSLF